MSPIPAEANSAAEGSGLLTLTRSLERRHARLKLFLRFRSAVALLLLMLALCGAALASVFLAAGLGLLDDPRLTRWASGFDAVLAVFLPSAFTVLTGRTGLLWWRGRHTDAQPLSGSTAGCV
ncbi:MAG: hypothetical protein ACPGU1_20600 [Myxococcota bacterium]